MKVIIVTQENKIKNSHILQGKEVGDIVTYTENNFPKVWNNANVSYNSNLPEFLNTIEPILTENQQIDYNLNNGIADVENGTFTYGVIDIPQQSIETKLENLRFEYSQRISEIQGMREAIERNIIDGTPIPNEILEQREVLKNEYNIKVNEISKINN